MTTVRGTLQQLLDWLHAPSPSSLQVLALLVYMLAGLAFALFVARRISRQLEGVTVAGVLKVVATAPTTNIRLLNGISLATIFVLGALVLSVLGLEPSETVLLYIGGFILIQEGLDVAHFGWKRATFKPEAAGMMRESVSPAPPTPAAEIVEATGEPAVPAAEPPPAEPGLLERHGLVHPGDTRSAREVAQDMAVRALERELPTPELPPARRTDPRYDTWLRSSSGTPQPAGLAKPAQIQPVPGVPEIPGEGG